MLSGILETNNGNIMISRSIESDLFSVLEKFLFMLRLHWATFSPRPYHVLINARACRRRGQNKKVKCNIMHITGLQMSDTGATKMQINGKSLTYNSDSKAR